MEFDFGFSLYFLETPIKTRLESFFIMVQNKLQIYIHHSEITVKLYQEEYQEQMAKLKADFEVAMQEANAIYRKCYDEIEGNDYDKHSYALHESSIQEIEHYYEVDNDNLKSSFSEMADHFNKSSLVALYALLETELRRLCNYLRKDLNLRVPIERFERQDYLQSIIEYLDLIAELDVSSLTPYINRVKELQFLRNRIMHNGGEFPLEKNQFLDDLVSGSRGTLTLELDDDGLTHILRIRSKYLTPYYGYVANFFFEVFNILNKKFSYKMLAGRIAFLFRFLTKDLTADYKSHKNIKNGTQFIFQIDSNDFDNLFQFNCKLTITKSKGNDEFFVTNQLDEIENVSRLICQITKRVDLAKQIFNGYLAPHTSHKVELMLYPVN